MTNIHDATIDDLTLDTANLNAHTKRGTDLTNRSIERFGSRSAGILDANNIVIDANLCTELYADRGIDKIQIIDADPKVPVYIRFKDLDLVDSDNPARELQLALHRSAVESFDVDAEMLAVHLLENEEIATDWFFESELQAELEKLEMEEIPPVDDGVGDDSDRCPECGRGW